MLSGRDCGPGKLTGQCRASEAPPEPAAERSRAANPALHLTGHANDVCARYHALSRVSRQLSGVFGGASNLGGVLMVEVSVEGTTAVFTVQGWDKLWALRSRLEIPLAHISDVHTDASPKMGWFQGLKMLGTDIPNVFRAGTVYQ